MTDTLLTYHGDPAIKVGVLSRLALHREADEIVQGTYWSGGKGCAVGCLTYDPAGGHARYPELFGVPEWLARLEDTVFEGLPVEDAKRWPERFMGAIPVGVEITERLADRLAIARLRVEVLPLASSWPDGVREQVVGAVQGVIDALERDDESARSASESASWSAAESASAARRSARSAARSAASAASAAWSASESASESASWSAAESAAWSARSAAWSARSARSARSAAVFVREADRIIGALEAL